MSTDPKRISFFLVKKILYLKGEVSPSCPLANCKIGLHRQHHLADIVANLAGLNEKIDKNFCWPSCPLRCPAKEEVITKMKDHVYRSYY